MRASFDIFPAIESTRRASLDILSVTLSLCDLPIRLRLGIVSAILSLIMLSEWKAVILAVEKPCMTQLVVGYTKIRKDRAQKQCIPAECA